MCSWFNILLLLIQVSRCTENVDMKDISSVTIALYCPTTKEEWDSAAKRKKCGKFSAKENFTADGKQQEYHCVINPFLNETLEVCAEPKILLGFCAEFNVAGGVIQNNEAAPCDKTFPKCDAIYNSREAYKYPDCYRIVYNSRNSKTTTVDLPQEESEHGKEKTALFVATAAVFVIVCFSVGFIKRTKIQTPTQHEDEQEIESHINTGPESNIMKGECLEINETINRLTAMPEDVTSQDGIIEESNENLFEPPDDNKDAIRSGFKTAEINKPFDEFVIEMTSIRNLLKAQNNVLIGMAVYCTKIHSKPSSEDLPPSSHSKDLIEELPLD